MKKSPLILLLLLLCMVLASALIHQNDPTSIFEGRGDRHLSSLKDGPGLSGRLFMPFMQYRHLPADEMDFLQDNIIKAEIIRPKLMLFTAFLKEEGNDVGKLESLIHEYDLLVKDARINFDLAGGSDNYVSENPSPELTEEEYLDLSRKRIMQSNMILRDIFHELQPYISGHNLKLQDGSFVAEGSGIVMLIGDFDADLSFLNGRISYMDARNDLKIEFEAGNMSGEMLADSRKNMVFYDNVSDNVTFSGSGYNLVIFGENISMSSKGTGEVKFLGNGYYEFNDHDGTLKRQLWLPALFEDN